MVNMDESRLVTPILLVLLIKTLLRVYSGNHWRTRRWRKRGAFKNRRNYAAKGG
jgi:hypothetical protein